MKLTNITIPKRHVSKKLILRRIYISTSTHINIIHMHLHVHNTYTPHNTYYTT